MALTSSPASTKGRMTPSSSANASARASDAVARATSPVRLAATASSTQAAVTLPIPKPVSARSNGARTATAAGASARARCTRASASSSLGAGRCPVIPRRRTASAASGLPAAVSNSPSVASRVRAQISGRPTGRCAPTSRRAIRTSPVRARTAALNRTRSSAVTGCGHCWQ